MPTDDDPAGGYTGRAVEFALAPARDEADAALARRAEWLFGAAPVKALGRVELEIGNGFGPDLLVIPIIGLWFPGGSFVVVGGVYQRAVGRAKKAADAVRFVEA